jgi:hypothetical protein
MTSSRVSQVVPGSTLAYAMTLRVRHPTLDPAQLTETLHLEPRHSWRAGEPRRSATGTARKLADLNIEVEFQFVSE